MSITSTMTNTVNKSLASPIFPTPEEFVRLVLKGICYMADNVMNARNDNPHFDFVAEFVRKFDATEVFNSHSFPVSLKAMISDSAEILHSLQEFPLTLRKSSFVHLPAQYFFEIRHFHCLFILVSALS